MWIKTVFTYFLITQHSSPIRLVPPPPPPPSFLSVFNGHTRPVILNQSQANVPTYLFKTPTCVHWRATPQPNGSMRKTVKTRCVFFFHSPAFKTQRVNRIDDSSGGSFWGAEICFYANVTAQRTMSFTQLIMNSRPHLVLWDSGVFSETRAFFFL